MAKQNGIIPISGTIGGITFYQSNGKNYAKRKSSIDKERFRSDPAFERTRKIADQKKITAPIASIVYQTLPQKMKKQGMIGKMIAEADRLHRSGLSEADILNRLQARFCPPAG